MDLEEQKEAWRNEQLEIALQVEVLPDPTPSSGSTVVVKSNCDRFRSVRFIPSTAAVVDVAETQDNSTPSSCPVYYYYGGVDVSFPAKENEPSVAVYVVLQYPSGKVIYQDSEYFSLEVPYIPSYLAFREIAPLERLIKKQMQNRPDLTPRAILVDGNGILHPRKAGIACFVGVRTGMPTIGVGKTLFYEGQLNKDLVLKELEESLYDAKESLLLPKRREQQPVSGDGDIQNCSADIVIIDQQSIPNAQEQQQHPNTATRIDRGVLVREMAPICGGFAVPLTNEQGETLACALVGHGGRMGSLSKASAGGTKNPIYISIGHKVSLLESVRICASFSFCKIPEPVRQADLIGRELLRSKNSKML